MQINNHAATTNIATVGSSLAEFYQITGKISAIRFTRITGKHDDIENILYTFTYRKRKFSLHYDVYHGVVLSSDDITNQKLFTKLASKLQIVHA